MPTYDPKAKPRVLDSGSLAGEYKIDEQTKHALRSIAIKDPGVKIGFPDLEVNYDGGCFSNGTLHIVQARSKVGKTYFTLNAIEHCIRNLQKCMFFSLEMGATSVLKRLSRLLLRRGYQSIHEDIDKHGVEVVYGEIHRRYPGIEEVFKLIDCRRLTLREVKNTIVDYKPMVVFIDHLLRIAPVKSGDQFEEVTEICYGLSDVAVETNVPLFVLAQINRGEGDGSMMPSLSGGKGSGAIEETADSIIGMCRPEIASTCTETQQGLVKIQVMGNRHGESSPAIDHYYDPFTGLLMSSHKIADLGLIDMFRTREDRLQAWDKLRPIREYAVDDMTVFKKGAPPKSWESALEDKHDEDAGEFAVNGGRGDADDSGTDMPDSGEEDPF